MSPKFSWQERHAVFSVITVTFDSITVESLPHFEQPLPTLTEVSSLNAQVLASEAMLQVRLLKVNLQIYITPRGYIMNNE